MTIRQAFRPLQRRAASFRLPALLLGLLLLALAGCGGASPDPLLAARVDAHGISLGAYQHFLSFVEAQHLAQGENISWQTPAGRAALSTLQQQALDALIDAQLIHDQAVKYHVSVQTRAVVAQVRQLATSYDQGLAQNPGQPGLVALKRMGADALTALKGNPHLDLGALLEASAPNGLLLNAVSSIEQEALVQHVKVPTVHLRVIFVHTEQQARDLEAQAQRGADFGQLARQYSLDTTSGGQGGDLGTIYIGQLLGEFDQAIFGTSSSHAPAVQYLILPLNGSYVLSKVTDRGTSPITALGDPQTEVQVLLGWITRQVRPRSDVATYVAFDQG